MRHKALRKAELEAFGTKLTSGVDKLVEQNAQLAMTWTQAWVGYATGMTGIAMDVLTDKDCTAKSALKDSVLLSVQSAQSICGAYKDLVAQCLNLKLDVTSAGAGFIFFQIDTDSECASAIVVGGVRASDYSSLSTTDLVHISAPPIPHDEHVLLKTDGERVLVYLADLGRLKLPAGLYTGHVLRDGKLFTPITVNVAH